MRQRILAGAVVVFLSTFSGALQAETLTFHYAGIVDTYIDGNFDVSPLAAWIGYTPALGDSYDSVFSFTTAADQYPNDPTVGGYELLDLTVTVGAATVGPFPIGSGTLLVRNDFVGFSVPYLDYYLVASGIDHLGPCPCDDIYTQIVARVGLQTGSATPGGPLASDALPLAPPSPGDFAFASMSLYVCSDDGSLCNGIAAHNLSVVPIPAVGWLLGPALGALGYLRRRVLNN